MKRTFVWVSALAAVVAFSIGAQPAREHREHRARKLLGFESMYGVDGPFLGEENAIRDVEGDEAPWVVASARGSLDTAGHLRIRVRGLVFADDPLVPPPLVGRHDEEEFRGLVICLCEVRDSAETANVMTRGIPATESGDSTIDARVDLPNTCVAPIVFVLAGSVDKWFALTGFESDSEEED